MTSTAVRWKERGRSLQYRVARASYLATKGARLRSYSDHFERFIILKRARTGSHLLISMLRQQRDVAIYGEIFRRRAEIERGGGAFPHTRRSRRLVLDDPLAFLETRIFHPRPRSVIAVGFNLGYGHAAPPEWPGLLDALSLDHGLSVVHLRRRNHLAVLVSARLAAATGQFAGRPRRNNDLRFELSPQECEAYFHKCEEAEHHYEQLFGGHRFLNLEYERLTTAPLEELGHFQEFFGLSRPASLPTTARFNTLPIRDRVQNYAQLQRHFQESPWAAFFAE